MFILLICAIFVAFVTVSDGQFLDVPRDLKNHGICTTRDTRENPRHLKRLENCTIIDGNLGISLMERRNFTSSLYRQNTIYNLREVTGFFVVYRTMALESLGDILPNLSLIRGNELFYDYSLVLHDNEDLKEVGLYNLLKIGRGGVAIQSSPKACFVETVDWASIGNPQEPLFIQSPPSSAHCRVKEDCSNCHKNTCWNSRHCQRRIELMNCHEQCLGCDPDSKNSCIRCKNYTFNYTCVEKCPSNAVSLEGCKYCILPEECPDHYDGTGWIWKNQCIRTCPARHKMVTVNGTKSCEPCEFCSKVCRGLQIRTLMELEMAVDCNFIEGYLSIMTKSPQITMHLLEHYLGSIKEIKDYLIVSNSEQITSLAFLKNLEVIGGSHLINGNFSVMIYNLPNLREIFPTRKNHFKINAGHVAIFQNRILCSNEIKRFEEEIQLSTNVVQVKSPEFSYFNAACSNTTLQISIDSIQTNSAIVKFAPLNEEGAPSVNYTVHYVQVDRKDNVDKVTEYCGKYSWKSLHVAIVSYSELYSVQLENLTPATSYAVYVDSQQLDETTHNLTSKSNLTYARSKTEKITTKSDRPPAPHLINLHSFEPGSFFVQWIVQRHYSSYVHRYILDVTSIEQNFNNFYVGNNCEATSYSIDSIDRHHRFTDRQLQKEKSQCDKFCAEYGSEREESVFNEDELFDICQDEFDCGDGSSENNEPAPEKMLKDKKISFRVDIPASFTSYNALDLVPFREYKLKLKACIGPLESDCGRSARDFVRTKPDLTLDLVKIESAKSYNGYINLFWNNPNSPNGAVLAYKINLREDLKCSNCGYSMPTTVCISQQQHSRNNGTYTELINLMGGDYEYQICTLTLAGETCTNYEKIHIERGYFMNETVSSTITFMLGMVFSFISFFSLCWYSYKRHKRTMEEEEDLLVENVELSNLEKVDKSSTSKPSEPGPSCLFIDPLSTTDDQSSCTSETIEL